MSLKTDAELILERFGEAADEAEKNRKPLGGFLGLGKTPADDPCHEIMDKSVEELAERAMNAGESAEEIDGLVNTILRAEKTLQPPQHARISLIAAHRHMIPLIPYMSETGKRELLEWYEKEYPPIGRFPIQEEVLVALGKKRKERGSIFRRRVN